MSIVDLLPSRTIVAEHGDVLLELAFLMAAVDGKLAEREVAAFRAVAGRIRGDVVVSDSDLGTLFSRYGLVTSKETIAARVRALAPSLPPDLRETAFKLAIALALVDHDAAASEDELMGVFFEALGLEMARADALAAEVRQAFGTPR